MTPGPSHIVPPASTCPRCGAPGQRFLRRCARCGRRSFRLRRFTPGAKH